MFQSESSDLAVFRYKFSIDRRTILIKARGGSVKVEISFLIKVEPYIAILDMYGIRVSSFYAIAVRIKRQRCRLTRCKRRTFS